MAVDQQASPVIAAPPSESQLDRIPLRANRPFLTLVVGQAFSAFGDAVNYTALPLLVLLITGSGFAMGIVGVLGALPDLVFGLVAGALADRWDRRRMMLWADLGRAVLTALIPLAYALGLPTLAVVLLVTPPIHVLRVLFMAAYTGAVPNLVGRRQIGQATSLFEAIYSLGWVLGPAAAGVLAATIGPAMTIAVDAASFVASAVALSLIRRPLRAERTNSPSAILPEIREGVRFVAQHRVLRLAIAFWGTLMIGEAGLIPTMTYFVTRDLGLGAEALGLIVSAFGLGSLLGSVAAGFFVKRSFGPPLLIGNLVGGVALLVAAAQSTLLPLVVCTFVAGTANSVVLVTYVTVRASFTPNELLGRVGSTARMVTLGLQPVGFLAAGSLLDLFAGRLTLASMAIFLIAATALFGLSATLREARPPERAPSASPLPSG